MKFSSFAEQPVIMICTGTGIASIRSCLQERVSQGQKGNNFLFILLLLFIIIIILYNINFMFILHIIAINLFLFLSK